MPATLRDRLGRPYTRMMDPELRRGRPAPNAGQKFPAEVLSPGEVRRLLAACGRGRAGRRNQALIVVLWRGGLRIAEALALEPRDVDREAGTLTVRHGKGNRRRVVGLDPGAMAVLERWLETRAELLQAAELPVRTGAVFCTITTGNVGAPVQAPYFREALKALAWKAGIAKRVHPHGLRHTHAVELMREGVPVPIIQRQLGHADLATTARYLDHLSPAEVIARMQRRELPAGVGAELGVGSMEYSDGIPGQLTVDDVLAQH